MFLNENQSQAYSPLTAFNWILTEDAFFPLFYASLSSCVTFASVEVSKTCAISNWYSSCQNEKEKCFGKILIYN